MYTTVGIRAEERFGASTHYHIDVHSQVGVKAIQNKTYADFEQLYRNLNKRHQTVPPIPAKKGQGDSKKQRLESTRSGLENWMNKVLARQETAADTELCGFINTSPAITTHGFTHSAPTQQLQANDRPVLDTTHGGGPNPPFQQQAEVQQQQHPTQPSGTIPSTEAPEPQALEAGFDSQAPTNQARPRQEQLTAPTHSAAQDEVPAPLLPPEPQAPPFTSLDNDPPTVAEPPSGSHISSPPATVDVPRLPSLSPSMNAADFMNQMAGAWDTPPAETAPSMPPAPDGHGSPEATVAAPDSPVPAELQPAQPDSVEAEQPPSVEEPSSLSPSHSLLRQQEDAREVHLAEQAAAMPVVDHVTSPATDPLHRAPSSHAAQQHPPHSPPVNSRPDPNNQPSPPLQPPPWMKEIKGNNQLSQKWGAPASASPAPSAASPPNSAPPRAPNPSASASSAPEQPRSLPRPATARKRPTARPAAKPAGFEDYAQVAHSTGKTPRNYPGHLDLNRLLSSLPARGASEPDFASAVLPQFTPVPGRAPKSLYQTSPPSRPAPPAASSAEFSPPIHRSHNDLGPYHHHHSSPAHPPPTSQPPSAPEPPPPSIPDATPSPALSRAPSAPGFGRLPSGSGALGAPKPLAKGAARQVSRAAYEGGYSGTDEERARAWLQDLTQTPLEGPLEAALRSGVVLCSAVNRIRQGRAISRISKLNLPFPQRENIAAFCAAAREMGVPDRDNFTTEDLYDGRNFKQVLQCVFSLGRNSYYVPDWDGPCLGQPEPVHEKRVWKRG